MNFVLAFFDVYHNIEIFHLNYSNKFENEINKQLERKIELMKPMLESLNLGNDENPCLIKIDSTLNSQEKQDPKELLIKYQEVSTYFYEDMFDIDPEITQNRIDIHSHSACEAKVETHESQTAP